MKTTMWACTALLLLVAMCADAEVISSFRAYVISVDVAANSVKLKYTDEETPTNWKETTATWNKDTEWVRADKEIWKQEPATAELAKQLKKDAKVYVRVVDPERKGARLERLSTIPPDSTVP